MPLPHKASHQPEVERHDISGCFKFLWIFGREGAGTHCGARTAWVNAVDAQALLIFIGQYLHHPFGGKFRRCIWITLLLSIVLTILVTIFCSVPIIIAGIVKLLLPVPVIWRKVSRFCDFMMYCWCEGLAVLLHLNPHLQWEVHGLEGLSKKNWYLLICNHRSWADIVVLCVLFRKHIPMNKYFLKQQLAWVPFLGLACWALDMPFMKRYSRAYLLRHPKKKVKSTWVVRGVSTSPPTCI